MSMRLAGLVFFLLVGMVQRLVAQSPSGMITGSVRDSISGALLEEATVSLYQEGKGLQWRVFAVRRNSNRGFLFRGIPVGNYWLVATYLGYEADSVRIDIGPRPAVNVLFRVHRSGRSMMQVVVTARIPPAIVRHDTVAFNAGAYPTQPNATLEDLLRKLPGIDIDKDGNVTMQGKRVDKIYIDGKEFFLNDPRLATANLPADIIDQIEAFDSQGDRARLTGIRDNTGTKSLNIRLKKNRRQGFFGLVYAGTGTGAAANPGSPTGSYAAGGNVMTLGKHMLLASGSLNNLNNQFTGTDNRNGPGTSGVQTLNRFNLNYRQEIGKLTATLNGGTSGGRTVLEQLNTTQTTLTDSSLLSNRNSQSVTTNQQWNANVLLEYKPDSLREMYLRSGWGGATTSSSATDSTAVSTLKSGGTYLDNEGRTVNSSRASEFSTNNQFNFRQRWRKPGRTLFIGLTESHGGQVQPQTTYSLINNFDSTGNLLGRTLIDETIHSTSGNNGYGAQIIYTEPLSTGHLLDWDYHLDRTVSRSDRSAFDYDSVTGEFDIPDSVTSNHFTTTNTIQRAGMGYNATDGRMQYQLGLTLQLSELDNLSRSTDSTLRLRQTNWYPRVSLIYTPGQGRSLNLQYSATTTSPTLQQLQPVADPTNPFFVPVGNPGLEQELTQHIHADYAAFNSHTFQNWQLSLDGSYSEHAIVPSTTVLAGGIQQQQFINVNGVWNAQANVSYGFPLGDQRKGNGSIAVTGKYNRGVSIVNGVEDVTMSPGGVATGKLNLHPGANWFIEATGSVNYTNNRYSVNPTQNSIAWTQNYSLHVNYSIPRVVGLSTWYSIQKASGTLPAPPVSVWNASAWKEIGRRRAWELRLSAFGLLNKSRNISQAMGPGFVSTTQTNIPGRIVLLSLTWRFRKFRQ
jgi:Outer membrane protein beta-barrel family/Carboxypeptidase regulatory-like domain